LEFFASEVKGLNMHVKELDLVVISDVHLGTYGCHAKELVTYLKSIRPGVLVLNGDIIDAWQFRKKYFPKSHLQVIEQIIRMSVEGTRVYYITGNHDDILRRFSDTDAGNIYLRDKLVLQLGGNRIWIFHGDIFDASVISTPLLAKLGGNGYDLLIRINRWVNKIRQNLGMEPYSFSGKIKSSVKQAVRFIQDFENKAIEVAAEKGFDTVICGHIHQPQNRMVQTHHGDIHYLNAGDWIENLTALEYRFNTWNIYRYDENDYPKMHRRLRPHRNKTAESTDPTGYALLYEKIVGGATGKAKELHTLSDADRAGDVIAETRVPTHAQSDVSL
jgi:UDP-2,3-diacylglucosamine pyrophosphatase LpxH